MFVINVDPIAFTIGTVNVAWYSIMIALAVLTLVLWTLREIRKGANIPYRRVIYLALIGVPAGIIFARLAHVIDLWGYFSQNLDQIIGGAGLAIYGAVFGAVLVMWIYSRVRKFSFGYLVDVITPGILLAQAIGRVGCTLNGCSYGVETRAFTAVIFSHPASFAPIGVPVHPTQIYEIIYVLIVFAVLLRLRGRFKPDGSLFLIYLSLYSIWRFGLAFIREGTPFLFGLHEAQVIALIVLAVAVPILALKTRRVKKEVR